MNTRALPSALPFVSDRPVGTTGGLYVFALFYLGYAYLYGFLLTVGGM